MSVERQISKEARNYLDHIKNRQNKDKEPSRKSPKVTKAMCNVVKEMYRSGYSPSEITEKLPISSRNTVYYHVNDKCEHKNWKWVNHTECGWMRYHANNGASSAALAVLYDVDKRTIAKHVTGKCRHKHGCPTVTPEQLEQNAYSGPNTTQSVCEECSQTFEHRSCRERRFCSRRCNTKYAGRQSHI